MIYREGKQVAEKYKKEYVEGFNIILDKRQKEAEIIRILMLVLNCMLLFPFFDLSNV